MKRWWRVLVAAGLLMVVGCEDTTVKPPETGRASETEFFPRWSVGDSNSRQWTTYTEHPTTIAGVNGAGFVGGSTRIANDTAAAIARFGQTPDTVIVMGGVNDIGVADPAPVIAEMERFEQEMVGLGVEVWWVTEPAWWVWVEWQEPLNEWIRTREHVADCAPEVADDKWTWDGLHLTWAGRQKVAQCIDDAVGDGVATDEGIDLPEVELGDLTD